MSSSPQTAVEGPSTGAEPAVPFFRKKKAPAKARPTALRKRAASSDDDNDDASGEAPSVIKAERKVAYNPLKQSTGVSKRRRKLAGDNESSDEGGNEDVGVKYSEKTMARRRSRSRSKSPSTTDVQGKAAAAVSSGAGPSDGLYHGTANYGSQLPKGGARFGPVKGPDNVRTITLVDYQPDVCKDYKETGFCGFGDTCKFLHDRGDYLHGWQMDNMYLSNQPTATAKEDSPEQEGLPFACLICRQPFTDPIVTRCGHYFCSACAIKRFSKTPKCFACGAPTGGIFNRATRIIEMQKQLDEAQAGEGARAGGTQEAGLDGVEGLEEVEEEEA